MKSYRMILSLMLTFIVLILLYIFLELRDLVKSFSLLDYYRYKIKFLYLSWFLAFIYFFFFIMILYILRFFNLGKEIDLKFLYQILLFGKDLFLLIPFIYQLFLLLIFGLIVIIFLLFFYIINKYLLENLLKLYVFYLGNRFIHPKSFYHKLSRIGESDIISYSIHILLEFLTTLIYRNTEFCTTGVSGFPILQNTKLSKFHPYNLSFIIYEKKYKIFISLLPIIFIIIECLLNDFILKYFFYFMIIYLPIILLKKITFFLGEVPNFIVDIIWDLYYNKEEKNLIYALSPDTKPLWDLYFINNLQCYASLSYDFEFFLKFNIRFPLNYPERNVYMNELGPLCLVYDSETKSYRIYEEIEEVIESKSEDIFNYKLGKEWYLLAKK